MIKYGIAFLIICSNQFLIALAKSKSYIDIADKLTQPTIYCSNQKLAVATN